MRTLAIQSANGSNTDDDRLAILQEISQLATEIDRVADTTTFGGQNLLDGSYASGSFQVGADASQTISFSLASGGTNNSVDISAAGGFNVPGLIDCCWYNGYFISDSFRIFCCQCAKYDRDVR